MSLIKPGYLFIRILSGCRARRVFVAVRIEAIHLYNVFLHVIIAENHTQRHRSGLQLEPCGTKTHQKVQTEIQNEFLL